MDYKIFLDTIKNNCSFLLNDGYSMNIPHKTKNRNIIFSKKSQIDGFCICFNWTQYGENFHISGLEAMKRYNEIEKKMQKVNNGELDDFYTIHKSPIITQIPSELDYNKLLSNNNFILKNISELILFIKYVEKFYNQEAILFFNKFNDLEEVNLLLKDLLDSKKIQSLLVSDNNLTIVRFYLIALYFNNLEILEYFNKIYFPYLEENLEDITEKTEKERLNTIKLLFS